MKPNMRWQLLFAVTGFALVLALLSYHVQSESKLCSERFAASGGLFIEGVLGAPEYINPLLAGDNPVDRQLTELVFDGLTRFEDGAFLPSLAESWDISEDGRTVRFELRDDVVWHDGEPFTADDVAFTYSLMQDDDFPGDPSLGRLWQSIVIRPVSDYVIEFELREPYAGFLSATTMGILPAHKLADVTAGELTQSAFNQNPIGTGPFQIEAGQAWQADGLLRLTPFDQAWSQGTLVAGLAFRFYPTEEALVSAFSRGEIHAISSVSPAMLPEVVQIHDARLFSAPAARYSSLLFNLGEKGSEAIRNRDVRLALAYALDRESIIDRSLNGQGIVLSGPYLPDSWAYRPETVAIESGGIVSATASLDAASWLMADDSNLRQNNGEPLTLRFLVFNTPTNRAVAEEIERQLNEIGAAPLMSLFSDWRDFRRALDAGEFDLALVDVAPSGDPDLYDFWSQEAIINGQNYSGWNRRRASEALEDGRRVWELEERLPYYDAFQRYYAEDIPELTLFQQIYTYAVKDSIEGLEIGRIDSTRDRYGSLADWILSYQDITVLCPEEAAQVAVIR